VRQAIQQNEVGYQQQRKSKSTPQILFLVEHKEVLTQSGVFGGNYLLTQGKLRKTILLKINIL